MNKIFLIPFVLLLVIIFCLICQAVQDDNSWLSQSIVALCLLVNTISGALIGYILVSHFVGFKKD